MKVPMGPSELNALVGRWRNRLLYRMPDRYGHLTATIRARRPRVVAEVGVWDAMHSAAMLREMVETRPPEELTYYGFDLFDDADDDAMTREHSKSPRSLQAITEKLRPFAEQGVAVHLIKGDTKETIRQVSADAPPVDFAFIDGGHSYETVSSDWQYVRDWLHPSGVAIFDDYVAPGGTLPEGHGINRTVDAIPRDEFRVQHLAPIDEFKQSWGLQRIQFVLVERLVAHAHSGDARRVDDGDAPGEIPMQNGSNQTNHR